MGTVIRPLSLGDGFSGAGFFVDLAAPVRRAVYARRVLSRGSDGRLEGLMPPGTERGAVTAAGKIRRNTKGGFVCGKTASPRRGLLCFGDGATSLKLPPNGSSPPLATCRCDFAFDREVPVNPRQLPPHSQVRIHRRECGGDPLSVGRRRPAAARSCLVAQRHRAGHRRRDRNRPGPGPRRRGERLSAFQFF